MRAYRPPSRFARLAGLGEAAAAVWLPHANSEVNRTASGHIPELYRPAMLLMGLALETALKGVLVSQNVTLKQTHNLHELCDQAGLALTTEDKDFLDRARENVEWVSKYPAPSHGQASRVNSRWGVRRSDWSTFYRLHTDLLERLQTAA